MMRLTALLLILAVPAYAGSLSLSVTTGSNTCPTVAAPSGGTAATQCVTGNDSEFTRVTAAYKALYGQICDTASPPVCRDRTSVEVFQALAKGLFDGIKANVLAHEKSAASKTAESGVAAVGLQ